MIATILIFAGILVSCKDNKWPQQPIHISPNNNSAKALTDNGPLDNILKDELLPYSMTSGYFSLITYNPKTQAINSIKECSTTDNGTLNLTINRDESFIISLPTFATVTYSWKITNTIDNTIFKLDQISSIHLKKRGQPSDTPPAEIRYGEGDDSQNFYFSNIKTGSQSINFECSSDAQKSTDNFKINLNIQIS